MDADFPLRPRAVAAAALVLLAACSAASGEHALSESEGMSSPGADANDIGGITNAFAGAGAGSITITFDRDSSTTSATVQVIGPDGVPHGSAESPSTPEHLSTHVTTIAGVQPCEHYQWKVFQTSTLEASGWVNTLTASGGTCPSSESFPGTSPIDFRGVHHDRFDHSWCTSSSWNAAYAIYPTGTDWVTHDLQGASAASWQPLVGYDHFYDPGSDPFPCGEQLVDAYRASVSFVVPAIQAARATDLAFTASWTSFGKSGPRPDLCVPDVSFLVLQHYPYPTDSSNENAYGATFADVLGGFSYLALERYEPVGRPLVVSGGSVSADFGPPVRAADGTASINVGLASTKDGFASQILPAASQQWAADDDKCVTRFSNLAVRVAYAPLAPNDPMCSATLDCMTYTAQCTVQAGESFALHRVNANGSDVVVASSVNGQTPLYDTAVNAASAQKYSVCATNVSGTTCRDVPAVTASACGGGGGGVAGPPKGTCGNGGYCHNQ